jgi:ELWxxDGT repeat protein
VELWESNGSASGTSLVKEISPPLLGTNGSYPSYLANVSGTLFFSASDSNLLGGHGRELCESDGTAAGTFLVQDINTKPNLVGGTYSSYPKYLTNVNGALFFSADDGTHGREPWILPVSTASTTIVSSSPNPSVFRQTVTFTATVSVAPGAGSPTGTVDFKQGLSDLTPGGVTLTGGQASFSTTSLSVGSQTITAFYSGDVTFLASSSSHTEVVNQVPSLTPTLLSDINPAAGASSNPKFFTQVNGLIFFQASDGTHGTELWESNGTAAGTRLVKDINPGASDSNPVDLTNVNGTLFFQASDGTHGAELWESNGTPAGTFLVADINPGAGGSSPSFLTNVNGTLFFQANDGSSGAELWRSNGTAAGTFMIKDIRPGTLGSYPMYLTNVNGTLFFDANDGTHGRELWRSNGSPSGTFLVQDIRPGGSYPGFLTNVNGTLFFSANDGTHGYELWASNGSPSGTFLVRDIRPGTRGSGPHYLTNVNGTVFFQANDGTTGIELWRSNGTPAGTTMVLDINPGTSGSYPFDLTNVNGTLFFEASEGAHGRELWRSNGSPTGTFLVQDIYPGKPGSNPANLTNVNGTLFFSAVDLTQGVELWTSNGVAAGTFLVQDINPGSSSSNPGYLTNFNGTLLFRAGDGTHGIEPWILPVSTLTTTTVSSSPNPAVFGQAVTFTAAVHVAPGSANPTGTVDFKEGSTDLTPGGVTLSGGRATFTSSSLSVGRHTLTASYGGDAHFTLSQGNDSAAPEVVNKAASRTVLTAFPDPAVFGQVVSFTVTLAAVAPGRGMPTGTATFTDGMTTMRSVSLTSLSGGRATFTTSSLSRGSHIINVNYSGDSHFLASAYTNFGQGVRQDATSTTLAPSANPVGAGQTLTLTATVQASAPGSGTPTGTVAFKDVTTVLGTGTLNGAGRATFTTSSLAIGTHTITASYVGNNNFTSSFSQNIAEVVKSSLGTMVVVVTNNSNREPVALTPIQSSRAVVLSARGVDYFFGASVSQRRVPPPRTGRPNLLIPAKDWLDAWSLS